MMAGVITLPFVMFFNWDGIWILYIANKEACSLSEAKRILSEGIKYKFGAIDYELNMFDENPTSTCLLDYEHINTYAYKSLPFNTNHRH